MLVEASRGLILILGLLVCSMSIFGLAATDRLLGLVRGVMDRSWGMVSAIGVRLVMGAALIIAAPVSRFPLVFEVIGWIALGDTFSREQDERFLVSLLVIGGLLVWRFANRGAGPQV